MTDEHIGFLLREQIRTLGSGGNQDEKLGRAAREIVEAQRPVATEEAVADYLVTERKWNRYTSDKTGAFQDVLAVLRHFASPEREVSLYWCTTCHKHVDERCGPVCDAGKVPHLDIGKVLPPERVKMQIEEMTEWAIAQAIAAKVQGDETFRTKGLVRIEIASHVAHRLANTPAMETPDSGAGAPTKVISFTRLAELTGIDEDTMLQRLADILRNRTVAAVVEKKG